jgi:hypothetical protein
MDDIKTWLQSKNKDYAQGVSLFEKYHKNKMLVRYFSNGNPATHSKKLEYELKKLTGIPLRVLFAENASQRSPQQKPVCVAITQLPQIIREAKNAVYELFTAISKMHRCLYELGESNSEETVKQRKELIKRRLPLIQRHEQLYLLKEQYFASGVIPVELHLLLKKHANSDTDTNGNTSNLQALSGIELMKKKQAITVAINKIQNRLHYQSLTKLEKPNPMPVSPLREKLETKLATLKEDLTKILQLIDNKK